eukprot:scaffold3225_cov65-Cyclotella_meneghiniana.AAC.12
MPHLCHFSGNMFVKISGPNDMAPSLPSIDVTVHWSFGSLFVLGGLSSGLRGKPIVQVQVQGRRELRGLISFTSYLI